VTGFFSLRGLAYVGLIYLSGCCLSPQFDFSLFFVSGFSILHFES
jgi:hypothetical protein